MIELASLLAQDDSRGPWLNPQFILMAVAGLIYVITQIVSVLREHQKRVAREQTKREKATTVVFEERKREEDLLPPPGPAPLPDEAQPTPAPPKLQLGRALPRQLQRPLQRTMHERLARQRVQAKKVVHKRGPKHDPAHLLTTLGGDPERIRDAILLKEILGPPLSLRRRSWMDRRE